MSTDASKVHRYVESREARLLRLVNFLWAQIPPDVQAELAPDIEAGNMGWAIPSWECRNDDDWLTVDELATELGMTPAGIRNFPRRYGIQPVKGRYRWGDVIRRRQIKERTTP